MPEIDPGKVNYRVSEKLSFTLEFLPIKCVRGTLGTNAPRWPYERAASFAFHAHQFPLSAEFVEILDRWKYGSGFVSNEGAFLLL